MAITYQSEHPQYYRNLSDYSLNAECNLNSDGEYDLTKVNCLMLHSARCEEHSHGFFPHKDEIVRTVKYPGFSVISLGNSRNLWLPDTIAFELMRRDLRNNGHMLFYWDTCSVAIITDKTNWVSVFEEFLTLAKNRNASVVGLHLSV